MAFYELPPTLEALFGSTLDEASLEQHTVKKISFNNYKLVK